MPDSLRLSSFANYVDAKGGTFARVAIAGVLSRGEDIIPLIGARRRDRLGASLKALVLTLSSEDLATLERAFS
ncbi:MAG: aldo/keto reductase [Methylocystis sp.]